MTNTKPCALILHGWGREAGRQQTALIAYLSSRGYEVCVPQFCNTDRFSIEEVRHAVIQSLHERVPGIIVGISLGGLILPPLATLFPQSKLIFLATGPRLAFQNWVLRKALPFFGTATGSSVFSLLRKVPFDLFLSVYMFFGTRLVSIERSPDDLLHDMAENVKVLKDITPQFQRDIVRFVTSVDNADSLRKLPNKTLIISGSHDPLMPLALGQELHRLIPDSKLCITQTRDHATVFLESVYPHVDAFLKD